MSKKSFTIFILILVALMAIIGWYVLFGSGAQPKNPPGQTTGATNIFPFGQGSASTPPKTGNGSTNTGKASTTIDLGGGTGAPLPRLRQISTVPTAGVVTFDVGSTTEIRFIERATGHIFQTPSQSANVTQISSVTIPKIYEALWANDGSRLIIRYLKDDETTIKTFTAVIATSSAPEKALSGAFLPDNIQNVNIFGKKMFSLDESITGAQGVRANLDGSSRTSIFNSSFGDWRSVWTSKDVVLFPRPSAQSAGAAYTLDPVSGNVSRIINNIYGMAPLFNSDQTFLLYSSTNRGTSDIFVHDVKKGTDRDLAIPTLADKCVWSVKQKTVVYCAVPKSPDSAIYPDDWYKGKVSFADSLWKIDAATGETQNVFDPELEAGISMDMTNLGLDQSESAIVFIDKNDLTAWRYDLTR